MTAHSVTMSGTFGLNGTNPNALTLKVTFVENAINGYAAVSEVVAYVWVTNTADGKERRYTYNDAQIQISVLDNLTGKWITQTWRASAKFDVASGATVRLGYMRFQGIPNGSGTTNVKLTGSWATGTSGHGAVTLPPSGTTALTLTANQYCHPLAPNLTGGLSNGSGTSVLLLWSNRENQNINGVAVNNPYNTLAVSYRSGTAGVWSAPKSIPMTGATGAWPTSYTVTGLTPGMTYQFSLIATNSVGTDTSQLLNLTTNGTVPSTTGTTDSGANQESTSILGPNGLINYGVTATAVNGLNASASIIPKPGSTTDQSSDGALLTAGANTTVVNYCGDPRNYWQTATTGNTTLMPYVGELSRSDITIQNNQPLPAGMSTAMRLLGLAAVDRGAQINFLANAANSGNAATTVFIGGNTDAPSNTMAFVVPANVTNVGFSCMAFANSAANSGTRAVPPIRFNALYANGASVAGTANVAQANLTVNQIATLSAQYALPANTVSIVITMPQNTANTANWAGGYLAGESLTYTAFMVGFTPESSQVPYFDGEVPPAGYRILNGGDLSVGYTLASIPRTIGYQGNPATLP